MDVKLRFAETPDECKAVFRQRYEIYVEEMDRYRTVADNENRLFEEPIDAQSRLLLAERDGAEVGTMRWTWGGDGPFPERLITQYRLEPFLERYPAETMIVGERFTVTRPYRGTDTLFQMFCHYLAFANKQRIQLIFGDCEPHLLNLYLGLGFRTYSTRNISTAEAGYLIPLVIVAEDIEYMRAISSPLAKVLKDFGDDARLPPDIGELIGDGGTVTSERLSESDEYWHVLSDAFSVIGRDRVQIFDDLEEDRVIALLEKSNVIECRAGDHLLKKGNVAQNMYLILDGAVEVRDRDQLITVLGPGDLMGEIAFLLQTPRSADVYALTNNTRLLCLSESNMRKAIDKDPKVAATILLNISKMLCEKIVKGN
ncbi:MAG: cyclic nucleotide-binding domain-containing protein [Hyphomicrobiales bacterium]